MLKQLLSALLTLSLFSWSSVFAAHAGEIYCTPCHAKFQDAFNMSKGMVSMASCSEEVCHGAKERRYEAHKNICSGCHVDIHTVHREMDISVNCRICHQSPRGWNSSIAVIPSEKIYTFGNINITIPKSRECGYCHRSAAGAVHMHDAHERIMDKACQKCHGPRVTAATEVLPKEKVELELMPIRQFSMLFNEITRQIFKFYEFLRK